MTMRPGLAYRIWLGLRPSCHVATPLTFMNLLAHNFHQLASHRSIVIAFY